MSATKALSAVPRVVLFGLTLTAALCAAGSGSPAPDTSTIGTINAPVSVVLFSDFECPFCAETASLLNRAIESYPGRIRLAFKHYPLPMHKSAPLAHEAAIAAAEQGKFHEMHNAIFAEPTKLSASDLLLHAKNLGLDVQRFEEDLRTRRYSERVQGDIAEARALGVTGTPTLFINGTRYDGAPTWEQVAAAVDPAVLTSSASPKRLALNGDAVQAGDAVLGDPKAPVVVTVYSDFECPFCARVLDPLGRVMEEFRGKVRLSFKHFPLKMHEQAPLAHEAALAAGEQGKFWQMHDVLFANQNALGRASLLKHAAALNLDMDRFREALDSRKYRSKVEDDLTEGVRLRVSGTPTIFVNGVELTSGNRVEDFREAIHRELAVAGVSAAPVTDLRRVRGAADAPVTIEWFADISSALTEKSDAIVRALLAANHGKIRFILRHRPMTGRESAALAHEALEFAAEQGKLWEAFSALAGQVKAETTPAQIAKAVAAAGVAADATAEILKSRKYQQQLDADMLEARRREVRGAPTFFVNGKRIDGIQPLSFYQTLIDMELQSLTAHAKR